MESLEELMKLPHKKGVNPSDWKHVDAKLLILAALYVHFCQRNGIPIMFTSIIRAGIPGVSISRTHIEGRAFDASAHGWTTDLVDEFLEHNADYQSIGAISKSDGVARCFLFHEGTAFHLHAQVRP